MVKGQRQLKKGSALAVAIVVVLLLMLAGLSMMLMGSNDRVRSVREMQRLAARSGADAGITKAKYIIKQEYSTGRWVGPLPADVTGVTLTGDDAQFSYTIVPSPNPLPPSSTNFAVTISATGTCEGTARTVNCRLHDIANVSGIGVKGTIYFKQNFDIYSLVPGNDATLQTNSTSTSSNNKAIDIGKGKITSNLIIGQGGDPAQAIDAPANTGFDRKAADTNPVYPDAPLPTKPGGTKNLPVTASGGTYWSDAAVTNLTVPNGAGNVVVYVNNTFDGDITVGNGSTLTLIVNGDIGGTNNIGYVTSTAPTTTAQIMQAAGAITIIGTPLCKNIAVKNNWKSYGMIYAPSADMEFKNNAEIYGALIVNTLTGKNNAAFHYVPGLNSPYVAARAISVDRWWE